MRKCLYLLLITPILFLMSCSDGCIDDVIGTYEGTESCMFSQDVTVVISNSPEDNQVLLEINGTTIALITELSSNCGVLTVASQAANINTQSENVQGLFNLNGDALTGSLTYSGAGVCSYVLTRQ